MLFANRGYSFRKLKGIRNDIYNNNKNIVVNTVANYASELKRLIHRCEAKCKYVINI